MGSSNINTLVVNELIFFISNKIRASTKDEIVEMCAKFYSLEEINDGISVFESTFTDIKFSPRNKADASKRVADLYDKLFRLDSTAAKSPVFVAVDLSRVPQDRGDSDSLASMEQVLASLQSLKQTVSRIQSAMVTKDQLLLYQNVSSSSLHESSASLSAAIEPSAPPLSQETPDLESHLSAPTPSVAQTDSASAPPIPISSASGSLRPMGGGAWSDVLHRQQSKTPRQTKVSTSGGSKPVSRRGKNAAVVIGKNVNEGVTSWRGADLTVSRYIGRVAVGTTADDVKSFLVGNGVDVVSLEPLTVKHTRFVSFKLIIKKSQLPVIENADIWPEGVMIGRWWAAKPTTSDSNANSS